MRSNALRPSSLSRRRHQRPALRAFSLVEILVVIGIITVLISMVFVAIHFVIGPQRANSTRVTLQNLQGMLAELEAAQAGQLTKQPIAWLWTANDTSISVYPAATGANFWTGPTVTVGNIDQTTSLAPPFLVSDSHVEQRNGAIAVVNTSLAMTLLASLPDNRSRLQAMPQTQQFVPTFSTGSITLPSSNHFTAGGSATLRYVQGAHVKQLDTADGKMHFYAASSSYNAGSAPSPNSTGAWNDETNYANHPIMLKDAWDNPIIFVPGTGLRVQLLNGKASLDGSAQQYYIVVSPEGHVLGNGTTTAVCDRTGRPFFASAGPDGDFSTGDDNLYSFEK